MQGLFDKVVKGSYPKIPKKFSADLAMVIKGLLQVKPKLRPSCDQLLSHPIVTKRIKKLGLEEFLDNSILLKTIQPFNDPSKVLYNLPAPAYTSTEGSMLMNKDRFSKDQSLPNINKKLKDYHGHYPGVPEQTRDEDGEMGSPKQMYNGKKIKESKPKGTVSFIIFYRVQISLYKREEPRQESYHSKQNT
jgi:serine/threonine protein kinase